MQVDELGDQARLVGAGCGREAFAALDEPHAAHPLGVDAEAAGDLLG